MEERSVLVVGAGPTGLTLALDLHRRGVPFRIVDKAAAPSVHSKALVMQARTLEMYQNAGLADAMVSAGCKGFTFRAFINGRPRARIELNEIDSPFPYLLVISQADTERILTEHLGAKGVVIERRTELVALQPVDGGIQVQLRGPDGAPSEHAFAYVVGCDGAHSAVRKAVGLPFEGAAYEDRFMLADLSIDGPIEPGTGYGFMKPDRIAALLPMTDGRTRVIGMHRERMEAPPDLAAFQALLDDVAPMKLRVRDPIWMTDFRLHRRIAPTMRVGRVFLAGDAAHIHSPAGGQGMNTGIQDALNLGWKLALAHKGRARPELLDSYDSERHPVAEAVLRLTDVAFRNVLARNRLLLWTRNAVAMFVPRLPILRRLAARAISEIGISYRASPLASQSGPIPSRRVRPGDRAPDLFLDDVRSGRRTTLFAALTGPELKLVLFCGGGPCDELLAAGHAVAERHAGLIRTLAIALQPVAAAEAYVDPEGRGQRRYGLRRPAFCLIRPDGHIGAFAEAGDESTILAWLERWFESGVRSTSRPERATTPGC